MRRRALPAARVTLVPPSIRIDDLTDEPMPYDVSAREIREPHVIDVGEDLAHDFQAAAGVAR
jgi:hypothetical protein